MKDNRLHLQLSEDVLDAVAEERSRQDARWGQQDWPVNLYVDYQSKLDIIRGLNEKRGKSGALTWDTILLEEVYEALVEDDNGSKQEAELIQVAAVAVAMVECIRRKRGNNDVSKAE